MTNPIPAPRTSTNRANHANRGNALLSTGPRTTAGKQHSSLNATTHGLTSQSPVIATEDPAAYQLHCRQLFEEYQPATPTETQLVQELADTAWRLNRIPLLEAAVLDRAADIVDAHRALATLGMHYQRLSRQFQKSLAMLREIQADRAHHERRDLNDAAALLEFHKHNGIPWQPADHGFVFSKDQIERFAKHKKDLNASRHIEYVLFDMPPSQRAAL
jgi:hypothetical protein